MADRTKQGPRIVDGYVEVRSSLQFYQPAGRSGAQAESQHTAPHQQNTQRSRSLISPGGEKGDYQGNYRGEQGIGYTQQVLGFKKECDVQGVERHYGQYGRKNQQQTDELWVPSFFF